MRLRWILPLLSMALASAFVPLSMAEDKPGAPAPAAAPDVQAPPAPPASPAPAPAIQAAPANPEAKRAARMLIEEGLRASHAATIFSDLRRSLREVYIPSIRDSIEGNTPGVPPLDPKTAAALAKVLTVMDYARKAGDELDVALTENREAMISDAAEQLAKTAQPGEIEDVRKALDLPAVRKAFDALYAMSKLLTGFTYEDSRTFARFSAWTKAQNIAWEQALRGLEPGSGKPVPSAEKIAKAQALVNDVYSASHADEMVADVSRFVREVYAGTAPIGDKERQELIQQAQQWEFLYNMQKALALAAAPSVLAATFSDEQLEAMHKFVRSPAFAKLFNLVRDTVKAGTALTKEEALEAQKAVKELGEKAQERERNAGEKDRIEKEWNALAEKWTNIIKNRISPKTREGLERALEDLQREDTPL